MNNTDYRWIMSTYKSEFKPYEEYLKAGEPVLKVSVRNGLSNTTILPSNNHNLDTSDA